MFDSTYPVTKVSATGPTLGADYLSLTIYRFDTSDRTRYLVYVTEYAKGFHTIDFCRNKQKHSRRRFTELTGRGDAIKIISTVVALMERLLRAGQDDYVSFGFIGARMPQEVDAPASKRFRLYRKIMEALISPTWYEHLQDPSLDAYAIVPGGADREAVITEARRVFAKEEEE